MKSDNVVSVISSKWAFILAVSGAAIGIGSIWRVPYMIGDNGGGVFLLCYLFFTAVLGLPAMMAEIIIGKVGAAIPIKALTSIAKQNNATPTWRGIALLGTLSSMLILSFYCVVSGWGLCYFQMTLQGFHAPNSHIAEHTFTQLIEDPSKIFFYSTLFLIMTFSISAFSINNGIEKLNNLLMPLLYFVLIVLLLYVTTLSGFQQAIQYLFKPDLTKLTPSVLINAIGLAFFTLATGACCLMAYGAYMPKKQSIASSIGIVALMNTGVTLCAGITIFSIVFSYGLSPSSGPGLIFMTLPVALHDMPIGHLILPIFFFLLTIACWTSSVNLAEPLVVMFADKFNSRKKGALSAGIIVLALSVIPIFSFNIWNHITIMGKDIFSVYTGIVSDILLPVTGVLIMLFTGYVMNKELFIDNAGLPKYGAHIFRWVIRYLCPWMMLLIFISNIINIQ